jgi:hypothetical protein
MIPKRTDVHSYPRFERRIRIDYFLTSRLSQLAVLELMIFAKLILSQLDHNAASISEVGGTDLGRFRFVGTE